MKNIYNTRYKIVRYALEHNVSAAAREYSTTRKTVRKWRDRYLLFSFLQHPNNFSK